VAPDYMSRVIESRRKDGLEVWDHLKVIINGLITFRRKLCFSPGLISNYFILFTSLFLINNITI
jgi:hypothetical protein